MVKKGFLYLLIGTIIFAIWNISGGNLGVAATNAWDFTFDLLNQTSQWAITFWRAITD